MRISQDFYLKSGLPGFNASLISGIIIFGGHLDPNIRKKSSGNIFNHGEDFLEIIIPPKFRSLGALLWIFQDLYNDIPGLNALF